MSAHRTLNDMYRAFDAVGPGILDDPGNGGTIRFSGWGQVCPITTTTTETATLAQPNRAGVTGTVVLDVDGGDLTLTVTGGYNAAGDTSIVFGDAGDFVTFISIKTGTSYVWRVLGQAGTNASVVNLADNVTAVFGTGSDAVLKWNGTYLEHGPATGLWAGAPSEADPQYHTIAYKFFDDFYSAPLDAYGVWYEIDDGGTGTNATADGVGGIGTVVTAGADNDHHAITSVGEPFKFATGKKLWFEARFKLAEAATNESAWWFGLTDTLTTGGFQANTAGPLADYDGFLIWKDEATMTVDSELSEGTDQDTDASEATFVSNKWSRVGFYFDGVDTVTPYYDMNEAGVWSVGTAKKFAGNLALADSGEMHVVAGVKAGPANNAETLQIDYIKCVQLR